MRSLALSAAFFLCLGVMLLMTAADDTAQRKAELQMKRRLINHYPAAEFAAPINEGMK